MPAPAAFAVDDPQALVAFLRAHPLVMLVVNGEGGPVCAHAPVAVVCDEAGAPVELVGHVARANPFWRAAQDAQALAVFTGADAYVSPSFYPSKAEHGRVVPTWNYLRAEVRGEIAIEPDPAKMRPYLDLPTASQEAARVAAWAVDDAPADYVARMSAAVVGLRLRINSAKGAFKLSQNKDEADHAGVVAGLAASDRLSDRAVAEAMVRA